MLTIEEGELDLRVSQLSSGESDLTEYYVAKSDRARSHGCPAS